MTDFWSTPDGLAHHTPPGCPWPEGESPIPYLRGLFSGFDRVLEFGSGSGRLAPAFTDAQYIGTDVSPIALTVSSAAHPAKTFVRIEPGGNLPKADAALAYTVLLHVSDVAITRVLQSLVDAAPVIYVVEILGRKWRRGGNPPVSNREFVEYDELFHSVGATTRIVGTRPCVRYPNTEFTVLRADRDTP